MHNDATAHDNVPGEGQDENVENIYNALNNFVDWQRQRHFNKTAAGYSSGQNGNTS